MSDPMNEALNPVTVTPFQSCRYMGTNLSLLYLSGSFNGTSQEERRRRTQNREGKTERNVKKRKEEERKRRREEKVRKTRQENFQRITERRERCCKVSEEEEERVNSYLTKNETYLLLLETVTAPMTPGRHYLSVASAAGPTCVPVVFSQVMKFVLQFSLFSLVCI